MINIIDFQNKRLVQVLYELQKASYLVEASLIGFFGIPPLKESLEELMECDETFLGYFEGKELTGALAYTIDEEELTICRMFVHPNHFRKGIAKKLLSVLEEIHPELPVLKVSTGKDNLPAKRLYFKNGFQLVRDMEVVPGLFISLFEKRR
ncbi:MAG: GNAT family N-acetyltransferase [Neobacillus sp.]